MATREDYIYYARLAEQGERYEDMIKYMKIVSEVRHCFKSLLLFFLYMKYATTLIMEIIPLLKCN